ncbi:MAG: DNA primase [Clostridiales bacterium]|nr:DNA primase [Clostridiales bacterium]
MNRGFSPEWLDKLKSNNDIVTVINKYITLTKRGKTWWASCPFHYEKTGSFAVNEVEQYYHCFGCGASGDVIKFVEKFESLDFYDACKKLADYAGMELPVFEADENLVKAKQKREKIYQVLVDAARFYYSNLKKPEAKQALDYIASRKLDTATIKEFGIGCSTDWNSIVTHLKSLGYSEEQMLDAGVVERNEYGKLYDCFGTRLIFPIFNLYGNVVGFSARVLGKSDFAKYKNTAQTLVFDKSRCIYGIMQLKKLKNTEKIEEVVIVEGQMDVISLHKSGIRNAVACMGTALTINHAKDLKRFADKVILCFDGDNAGKKATLRSIDILVSVGFNVYIVTIPNGNDPDEYVNQYGKDAWDNLMSNALYWVEFLIKDLAAQYNLDKMDEKNKFIKDALGVVKSLSTQSEQEIYLKMIQSMTNVTINVLKSDLGGLNDNNKEVKTEIKIDKPINAKENAYVKAVKFVISALLYKKDYATLDDRVRDNLLNPDYAKIYDYIKVEYGAGRTPIVSKLFDMFDVEGSNDIDDIVNYIFQAGEDNAVYFEDCVKIIIKSGLALERERLMSLLATTKDDTERRELLAKIGQIVQKEKSNK